MNNEWTNCTKNEHIVIVLKSVLDVTEPFWRDNSESSKKTQMSESIFACSNCGVTLVFESKNVLGVFPMGVFHMKKRCEKLNHKTN